MNISNSPIGNPIVPGSTPIATNTDAAKAPPAPRPAVDVDAFEPSPEWTRMVTTLSQLPAVREDRIREVTERLRQGYYHTAESIAKTAEVMSQSKD